MIRKDWEQKQLALEAIERQKQNKNFKFNPDTDRPPSEDDRRGTPLFSFAEQIHAVGPEGKPQIIKPFPQ